jgi:hypothetical protein
LTSPGCPIRVPPDHRLVAPPRSISPLPAPFIGCFRQSILRAPLVACPSHPNSAPTGPLGSAVMGAVAAGRSWVRLRAKSNTLGLRLLAPLFDCQGAASLKRTSMLAELIVTVNGSALGGPTSLPRAGGGERTRTADILRARQALSQLSYAPGSHGGRPWARTTHLSLIRAAL